MLSEIITYKNLMSDIQNIHSNFKMMYKTILLVVLFGLCSNSLGHGNLHAYVPWKLGKCIVPPIVQNFDYAKYFSGRWYEQASFGNFLFQGTGICPTTQYEISDAGEINELDYHFEQWLMSYVSVRGSSLTQFIKEGQAYLPIKYQLFGGLVTYEAPIYIVETDYENWALVYSCKQQLFMKAEMSWIVARNRTGWNITEQVNDTILAAGLNPDEYVPSVNVGCGPNEPHL